MAMAGRQASIHEYLGLIRTSDDLIAIKANLSAITGGLGLDRFAYYVFRPPGGQPTPKNVQSYPEDWLIYYDDMGYPYVDATFSTAASTILPYSWSEIRLDPRLSKRQRTLFDEATEFGLFHGISVPLHGPEGGLAVLSFSSGASEREFDEIWRTRRDDLALVGAYTQEAMLRNAARDAEYSPIRLTGRERECLSWTSHGKTTWEVGEILSISEKTVLYHLTNAMRKLDVYSKHHAVVKALIMGLIKP
jgi:DNA-binding CsgD family transcriptional regulator